MWKMRLQTVRGLVTVLSASGNGITTDEEKGRILGSCPSCLNGKSSHTFTEDDCGECVDQRCQNGRSDHACGVDTAVLLPIGYDIQRNQLQGRNIDDEKIAHFIAGSFRGGISPFLFQICQCLHGF